jgi:hypothetical protein
MYSTGSETMVTRYVEDYFGKSANDNPLASTRYSCARPAQVQTKQKRKYRKTIAVLVLAALDAGT